MANKDLETKGEQNSSKGLLDMGRDFDSAFDNMVERFFGTRFNSLIGQWPEMSRKDVTNIHETEKAYILSAEIPGIPKENVQISVNGNLLTVRAEQNEESGSEKSEQGYRRQFRSFQQSFALPTTVDPEKIEANCENGVLEIMLPKSEQAQAKKIEVQSGKGRFIDRLLGKDGQQKKDQQSEKAKH